MTTDTNVKPIIRLVSNGPMTSFSLDIEKRRWHLCRDDLKKFAQGTFNFDDCRESIIVSESEQLEISRRAKEFLQCIDDEEFFADLGGGYNDYFRDNAKKYGKVTTDDLGRKFIYEGLPYVFLGAIKRARRLKMAAIQLTTGRNWKFTVQSIETCLGHVGGDHE